MRRSACRSLLCWGWLFGLMATVGCLPFPGDTTAPFPVGARLRAEYVVSGADQPYALACAADGRIFYTEKNTGRIRVIVDGALQADSLAAVAVNSADDRGLLGIALHPRFDENHRIYVFYTRSDTGQTSADPQAVLDNRVVYFEAAGNVAAGGEHFVAALPALAGTLHVSGRIAFAPDGKLLVGLGDLTTPAAAPDNAVFAGKILRYNDDGTIPADNPIPGSPVYARGLRDVRGLCIDPVNGTPFAVDRNDQDPDEVNRIRVSGNHGWPDVTGKVRTDAELAYAASQPDYVDPIIDAGSAAPGLVGGSFNPSTRYGPATSLQYFYGEASTRRVVSVELSGTRDAVVDRRVFASGFPSTLTNVVFTPAGTLYVACRSAIFRVVPAD